MLLLRCVLCIADLKFFRLLREFAVFWIRVHSRSFVAQMALISVHQRKSVVKRVLVVALLRCALWLNLIRVDSRAFVAKVFIPRDFSSMMANWYSVGCVGTGPVITRKPEPSASEFDLLWQYPSFP